MLIKLTTADKARKTLLMKAEDVRFVGETLENPMITRVTTTIVVPIEVDVDTPAGKKKQWVNQNVAFEVLDSVDSILAAVNRALCAAT